MNIGLWKLKVFVKILNLKQPYFTIFPYFDILYFPENIFPYICSMKNENKELLENAGFKFNSWEWVKDRWTIRTNSDEFEAFDEDKYYYGTMSELEDVLKDIG